MSEAEFDRHADNYRLLHKQTVAITGEEPAFFADYKMRDFTALLRDAGLPIDGRFLDFVRGIGTSVHPFREHLPRARLVCADVSADSLAISKLSHGGAVEHAWLPDGRLPFADHEFDGAFACCVFHHIPHERQAQALAEIRRVLKPAALLILLCHKSSFALALPQQGHCPRRASSA